MGRAQARRLPGPPREKFTDRLREGLHVKGHPEKAVRADPDGDVFVEKVGGKCRCGDDGLPVDALEVLTSMRAFTKLSASRLRPHCPKVTLLRNRTNRSTGLSSAIARIRSASDVP